MDFDWTPEQSELRARAQEVAAAGVAKYGRHNDSWMNGYSKEFAKENGYVETLIGRRRYLPDVNSKNGTIRQAAERNAVNMPVQGTSADMIKIAMVKVAEDMAKAKVKSKMLLQIHDELLFDAHVDEIDQLKEIVVQGMVNAIEMGVPVEVNVGIGDNWLEAH